MSLFSSNRISSIAISEENNDMISSTNNQQNNDQEEVKDPETNQVIKEPNVESSAPVKESDEEDVEDGEEVTIDPDVEDMLSDSDFEESSLYNVDISEEFSSILDTCININENDKELFDRMIEMDFITLCREHTGIQDINEFMADNDAKKANLAKNINKCFVAMEASITQLGAINANKIKSFIESEKALYDKYKKVLTTENLKGFTNEAKIAFPNINSSFNIDEEVNIKSIAEIMKEAIDGLNISLNKEEVDIVMTAVRERFDKESDKFIGNISESISVDENWIPDDSDIDFIDKYMNENIAHNAIASATDCIIKDLSSINDTIQETIESYDESTELNTYKVNKLYNLASSVNKVAGKKFQVYNDLIVREMANIRKAIIVCGSYANKTVNGKDTTINEAVLENVCDSSDTYVFEYFEK